VAELSDPRYHVDEPTVVDRVMSWVFDKLGEAFDSIVRFTPGGIASLLILIAAIVGLVIVLRIGLGPTALRNALTDRRRDAKARTADEYREEAEAFAARGDFKEAVRARFRAIIRELEQRAVLDPRAGRTAGEIAREGGAAVPAIGGDLRSVAGTFDQVWYGRRDATRADYDVVRDADERIRGRRLVTVDA
jgi:hypothetical protein